MLRIFDYYMEHPPGSQTIQEYLSARGYSRPVLSHLKKTPQSVLLNHKWEYMNTLLHQGDHLRIVLKEMASSANVIPRPQPLSICYEDEDLVIIDKPAGMPIHPSCANPDKTLANGVYDYFNRQNNPCTFRCVNRLDRDTTGLTMIAKHMLSSAILNQSAKNHTIRREYLAVAQGYVPDFGTIDAAIGRKNSHTDQHSIERQVDLICGKRAVTHYRRLYYRNDRSLIALHLETGRTHQIRVHLSYIGHPLIGDFIYHPDYRHDSTLCEIKRQALHSYRLQFIHPITNLPMDFTAPLPKDMECLL